MLLGLSKIKRKPNEKAIYSTVISCKFFSSSIFCVYEYLKTVSNFDEIYCWVDSSVVFAWINNILKFISSIFNLA